jgi:tetratricopeptide (TPR) repeat protein
MNRRVTSLRRAPEPVIRLHGKPFTVMAASAMAVEEHRRGNFQAALDIYGRILAKAPNYAEAYNNRGAVLQTMKRHDEALANYDKAIALKPDYANAHYNRGIVLKKMTRRDEALASYDRAIALNPGHVEAHNNRGVVLQELKRYDDALTSYDKAIALKPDHAEAHNNRGIALASKGDMAGAEKMFLEASELRTEFPDPLFNLANIRTYQNADGNEVKSIRALLGKPNITAEEQEHLYVSLGKIYDDCGHYDDAFECFGRANKLRNVQVAYDASLVERMTDGIIEVFNKDFLASPFAFASDTRMPVFIVGMPRSGTTLLASMLSNHPAVATAGELAMIPDFTAHLRELTGGTVPYPAATRDMTANAAKQLTNQYERRLGRDVDPAVPHVIDKNPLNFRHLGLIYKLFPRARIFHCTRHPLATCLSNYFQRFPLHMDYSFDLRNIGHFYGEYARLMNHWRATPTLKVMELSYENMILNTEGTARAALNLLGLEWDERCLSPHINKYAVETASQWQVRQPIYQHSLENWRHYEKFLAPLVDVISLAGKAHGK